LITDRNKTGSKIEQYLVETKNGKEDDLGFNSEIVSHYERSKDFTRLTVGRNGSPCWLMIQLDKISKNRTYSNTIQLDKAQAKLLVQNILDEIEKMED
jgi:hypothetical protein